jgi:hypothetical protein
MEDTTENKPKPRLLRMFMFGFIAATIISISLASWVAHNNSLKEAEYQRNQAARESIRLDSISKADKKIREYRTMVKALSRRDSVFASLKYVIGDIVYLKPDSVRGVIQNVIGDDQMDCFVYFVLCKNKDGQYEAVQRNAKLIY